MKTSNYFEYDSTMQSNPIPSGMSKTNFGVIIDFNFNFTNADLGTTKYFYISHDDSVNIIFNEEMVYNGYAGSRHAFYITVTPALVNKPLPCQIIWCQGVGAYKLQLRMSNSLGSSMSNYSIIEPKYISSLTPINEWGDAKNVSFYTFIQQLSMLFNHNHHYTDAGQSGDTTYSDLKQSIATASAVGTAYVPISTRTAAGNTSAINTQLINGAGFVREVTNFSYIDITISPFTVNL
jgi:hypothetical protein